MYNDNEKISASEINKYCYCEYSWYYERLYGKKYIREQYKKRNDNLDFTYKTIDNFKRGIEFHDSFLAKRKVKVIFKTLILIFFISLLLFILKLCGIF
ncbi:hypothetical protein [[Clostridium] colinum]|uniref:hypothetical protein n=1 Tax=[Clostridium] colinum TaxID=36835 RepID=UPI00202565E8|nr:hypothetical protein [[Clostridium] colinum]